ncbi:flavodoxin family protein [Synechococcus sp. RSCCF101]|uniref:flavodoxin family protein n=1 Tax=Synechococcus sp. RSCCF101 TaxID=2511069 RepID=UPI0012457ECB|nr:NAD(P)H-dependent oxidoreductase [Synechococcus sp. RSCCF101]QEY33011.1 flavodoxin family protein [Synechococcus sp. RSCCF101]
MSSAQCSGLIDQLSGSAPERYGDLKVLALNCTLNRTPVLSHTEGVIHLALKVFESVGASCELIRPVDFEIPAGLGTDMSATPEWDRDDWPQIQARIDACDILLLCTSVWLGEKTSVCNRVLERMYGYTHLVNSKGQYRDYGKVGATLITGNEDGIKHCAMNILFSLSHIGYTVPPQADAGWVGEAGPGPSYMDPGSGGPENDFTNRNTTFLAWNCLHLARLLKDAGGYPAHGNVPSQWDAGCHAGRANPEHRA